MKLSTYENQIRVYNIGAEIREKAKKHSIPRKLFDFVIIFPSQLLNQWLDKQLQPE